MGDEIQFKGYEQQQGQRFPGHLRDALDASDPVFFIDDAVESLDLSELERRYAGMGERAYPPRMLRKLWRFGATAGVYSGRELARRVHWDLRFWGPAGGPGPVGAGGDRRDEDPGEHVAAQGDEPRSDGGGGGAARGRDRGDPGADGCGGGGRGPGARQGRRRQRRVAGGAAGPGDPAREAAQGTGAAGGGEGSEAGVEAPEELRGPGRAEDEDGRRGRYSRRMARFLRPPWARRLYGLRKTVGERPFAEIKAAMGFRRFSLRGRANVRGEWDLVCAAFHLRRLWAALEPA